MELIRRFAQENPAIMPLVVIAFSFLIWLLTRSSNESKSHFRVREADRDLKFKREAPSSNREKPAKKEPLRLTGIVADGAPHEVLGVSALASESEIQKAFKEKMKRYHPDLMGPPGSREWNEATRIAEAINRAREEMLERLKRRPT
jgi:DnaJ-domain-containing protein 1